MVELIKIEEKNDLISEKIDYNHLYKLVKDEKIIGYGTINKDEENYVYIYIDEDARGNQYGKFLFLKILEEIRNMEYAYKNIKVKFDRKNVQMLKIVKGIRGLFVSTDEDIVQYSIPLV